MKFDKCAVRWMLYGAGSGLAISLFTVVLHSIDDAADIFGLDSLPREIQYPIIFFSPLASIGLSTLVAAANLRNDSSKKQHCIGAAAATLSLFQIVAFTINTLAGNDITALERGILALSILCFSACFSAFGTYNHFYNNKKSGIDALSGPARRKPNLKNRADEFIGQTVVSIATFGENHEFESRVPSEEKSRVLSQQLFR